ncbi:MAG: peptidoglycan recognition family protein [Oscillospiraceae bacterium]|nr:peptidoglycan recognition family protein [Oscillospiraceae bacterium]
MTPVSSNFQWAFALTPRSVTTHLILHHAGVSAATAAGIHAYHLSKGWAGIAYHYYVTKKGEVYVGRPENMRGGHTTNWNYCSIGICFEGNFETEQMTEEQLAAGKELVADIAARYPSIVIGKHSDFSQTACPGRNFPLASLVPTGGAEPQKDAELSEEPSDWAKSSCEWSVGYGLFQGSGDNSYRWHDGVTRQELAVILERASKLFSAQ